MFVPPTATNRATQGDKVLAAKRGQHLFDGRPIEVGATRIVAWTRQVMAEAKASVA